MDPWLESILLVTADLKVVVLALQKAEWLQEMANREITASPVAEQISHVGFL